MASTALYITSVKKGKNNYWLKFTIIYARLNVVDKTIDYCGTEINNWPREFNVIEKEDILQKLKRDFASAPFDIKEAKKKLSKGNLCYDIKWIENA